MIDGHRCPSNLSDDHEFPCTKITDDVENIRHYIRLMSYIYAYLSNIIDN